MDGFNARTVGGASLGESLRAGRQAAGMSLAVLSAATRIPEKYLADLEAGDYRGLPEPVYQRLFLKAVCRSLGLGEAAILERHAIELEQRIGLAAAGRDAPPRRASALRFLVLPRLVTACGVTLLAVAALGVLGYEAVRIVAPPSLERVSPAAGDAARWPPVAVAGRTERGVELRVNGEPVYLGPDGSFDEAVNLHRGVNVIKISAKKTHSDERTLYRRVLWGGPENGGGGTAAAVVSSTSR
jgi:cytoskeleton protein RodZ